jgi:hypothetical protein
MFYSKNNSWHFGQRLDMHWWWIDSHWSAGNVDNWNWQYAIDYSSNAYNQMVEDTQNNRSSCENTDIAWFCYMYVTNLTEESERGTTPEAETTCLQRQRQCVSRGRNNVSLEAETTCLLRQRQCVSRGRDNMSSEATCLQRQQQCLHFQILSWKISAEPKSSGNLPFNEWTWTHIVEHLLGGINIKDIVVGKRLVLPE